MSLSDEDLLTQFEVKTLPPDELNHVSHLRIAWLYLKKFDLGTAIEKTGTGTREYAENLGVYDKYHQTVTEAIVRIMDNRMKKSQSGNFEAFLQGNDDLVSDLKSVIRHYYSEEILESNNARFNFVPPDKMRFEERVCANRH